MTNAPIVQNNEICSNINFNVDNNTNVNYSLLSNCFCGLDSAGIEQYLIDGYDDITKGLINYQVFDSSCTSILATVLKFNNIAGFSIVPMLNYVISNPVSNSLQILSPQLFNSIVIVDLLGYQYTLSSSGENNFDLNNLAAGIYFLKMINQHTVNTQFVKL